MKQNTYIGASITQTINPKHEIRKRISAAMAILKKLDIFWLKTQCSKKWKLLVKQSTIRIGDPRADWIRQ